MFRLDYIAPYDLHSIWPQVREGIERVRHKTAETYLPEDVYHAIKSNVATLHMAYLDNAYAGFAIFTPYRDQYTNKMILHCWIAYSTGTDVFGLAYDEVMQMAHNIKAEKVTFTSNRKAWERRFPLSYSLFEIPVE